MPFDVGGEHARRCERRASAGWARIEDPHAASGRRQLEGQRAADDAGTDDEHISVASTHAPYCTTPAAPAASPGTVYRAVDPLNDERDDDDPDELDELDERLLDELLLDPVLELDELDVDDALLELLELLALLVLLDELEELDDVLDDVLEPDELDDVLLVLEELDDPADELLELLVPVVLDELDAVPPPAVELPPPLDEASSGDVGSVVQPDVRPAAITAAGAPESSSRNWRRFVSSPASVAGFGGLWDFCLFFTTSSSQSGQRQRTAPVVQLDPPDDLIGGDHVHAARQRADYVHAERVWPVVHVAIAEWQRPRLPAAAVVAAAQRTHRVDELVMRVGGEVRRFAATGHDDARPVLRHARFHFDGSRQMHEEAHGRERALRVVHQPDEFAVRGAATQIHHAVERGMVVVVLAHLHEEQPVAEVVDDGLVACRVPPFDRVVELPTRGEQPERRAVAFEGFDLAEPVLLRLVDVQVALEIGHADAQPELLVQVLDEAIEEVARLLVAAMDEGVVAVEHLHVGVVFRERRQVRIVVPEIRAGRADIGQELAGVAPMQVPHGGGQHHDVAGRLKVPEDELAHTFQSDRPGAVHRGQGVPPPISLDSRPRRTRTK